MIIDIHTALEGAAIAKRKCNALELVAQRNFSLSLFPKVRSLSLSLSPPWPPTHFPPPPPPLSPPPPCVYCDCAYSQECQRVYFPKENLPSVGEVLKVRIASICKCKHPNTSSTELKVTSPT
ncbi:hypothetical protein KP509_06G013100 [Ceratopteris richardii]|uniref:Uncharacterized protein n=1 Tax=Ceratopteris richardii TaxID=49495 RepID=A0A8T2UKI0_CERRI|nr:hypothetical protein KP509_06G013100 [Ceratopteris richardii]